MSNDTLPRAGPRLEASSAPIPFGEVIAGSLDVSGDVDNYTFTGAPGDRVMAIMHAAWENYPNLRLYAPGGSLVRDVYDTRTCNFSYALEESGIYTLSAGDTWNNTIGNYTLFLQRVSDPVAGDTVPIAFGETVPAAIEARSEMDVYTFSADSGDTIMVRMGSSFWSPELRLYDPTGILVGRAESGVGTCEITAPAESAGTYTLIAQERDGLYTGTYSVYLQRVNNPGTPIAIEYGDVLNGTITQNAELVTYTFGGTAGERVLGVLHANWSGYPDLRLYAPSGVLVQQDACPYTANITVTLPETGPYTLTAGDRDGDRTGAYSVYLQRVNNPVAGGTVPVAFGKAITTAIGTPGEMDVYTFSADAGDTVMARMRSSSIYLEQRLYDPAGVLINRTVDTGEATVPITSAGTYTLIAHETFGRYTGPYSVYLQRVNNPGTSIPIEYGDVLNGTITQNAELATYTFGGTAGERVLGVLHGNWSSYPDLRLYSPGGALVCRDASTYTANVTVTLPETGTYVLTVGDAEGDHTGAYSVYLQRVNNPVAGGTVPIAFGEMISAAIGTPSEMDVYALNATAVEPAILRMDAQLPLYNPELRLYGPDGSMAGVGQSAFFSSELPANIEEAGTYHVIAQHQSGTGTGNYTLSLSYPVDLRLLTPYTRNISEGNWNYYRFDVTAQSDMGVRVTPHDGVASLVVYCARERLPTENRYDFKQEVKNSAGEYDLLIPQAQEGTYYFAVYARSTVGTADYTINISMGGPYIYQIYPRTLLNSNASRLQVYGIGLTEGTDVDLRNGSSTVDALSVVFGSTTTLIATFDLRDAPLGIYDAVVIWPDGEERVFADAVEVTEIPEGMLGTPEDLSMDAGSTELFEIDVPETDDLYITLQKSSLTAYGAAWQSEVTVRKDGAVVLSEVGSHDMLMHLQDPEPGHYRISVSAVQAGRGTLTFRTALSELPLDTWVVDTIRTSYGSVFYQVTVPEGQDSLFFEGESLGVWSYFAVYSDYYPSSRRWQSPGAGEDRYTSVLIQDPEPGRYIVEFMDSAMIQEVGGAFAADQSRDVLIRAAATATASGEPPLSYLPSITKITPERGGNTGPVTVEVRGTNLDENATVSLAGTGTGSVQAVEVSGTPTRTSLFSLFNLEGCGAGQYTLTVTNPDGKSATSPIGFFVEDGGASDLWMEVVGRDQVRLGRPGTYCINYGNDGILDMPAPLLRIATVPASSDVRVQVGSSDWQPMDEPVVVFAPGPSESPDVLPAGYSSSIVIRVESNAVIDFSLQITPLTSDVVDSLPTLSTAVDAYCPVPGTPLALTRMYPNGYSPYLGAFGCGWIHTYDMRICRLSDGSLALQYGDRYPDTFVRDAEGHYTSELSGAAIEERGDGGFLIRETDGGMMNFGSDLLLESISDANGNEVSLLYDAQKHLVEIRHSCGDRFTLDYNADGFVYRLTDAAGLETRYTYDTTGRRLVSVATPDGGVLSYEYTSDAAPALASITDPSGVTVHFAYGGDGRLTETYLNDHRYPVKSTYDLDTRITTYTDASGGSSTKKLNEFGQVLWETNALGETTRYTYDDDRNLARITDAGGSAYSFEYDERDNLIRITDPLNHAITMGYEPDSDDLAWVRDGRNNQVTFDYDGHGNVNRVTYPDATHEDRTYNAAGNPVTTVTRKGDEISYTYNQRGQVARKEYPDGTWFAYTYDSAGNTITATDQSGTIAMEYTLKDQLSRISYPSGQWLAYTYDAAGRLLERTDQDGTAVRYEYDALGQLMRVKDEAGSVVVEYEYDARGYPSAKVLGNGDSTTYEYDAAGRILRLVNSNATGSVLSRFEYTYDLHGNPVSVETLEGTTQYAYDAACRLTRVTYPDGQFEAYSYDADGNRISVQTGGEATSYVTDIMDRYTSVGSSTLEYDDNGNLVSRNAGGTITTYEYDVENRLVRTSSPGNTWEYTYDALGNRIAVTQNGIEKRYLVDPRGMGQLIAEYDTDGDLTCRYIYGFGLESQVDSLGDSYYYHFTPVGHTHEITDEQGNVVNTYAYRPFGEYREKQERIANPFTYVGEFGVMDDGSDVRYMRMRYYAPDLGRFISEEKSLCLGKYVNPYTYACNNPVVFTDPTGLGVRWGQFTWGAIGVVSGVVGVVVGGFILSAAAPVFITACALIGILNGFVGIGTGIMEMAFAVNDREDPFNHCGGLSELIGQQFGDLGGSIGKILDLLPNLFTGNLAPALALLEKIADLLQGLDLLKTLFESIKTILSSTPEDKFGPAGFDLAGTPESEFKRFVLPDQHFSYRVDFWNKENATAPACDVYIDDDLDPDLDWKTFRFTEVGFLNWTIPIEEPSPYIDLYVDTRPEMNLIVRVTGMLDPATGHVNVTYRSLDPDTLETPDDPMAGFLPPITDSGYEIGWVSFGADPVDGLATGTTIENQAWVNFDGVPPTNPAPKEGPWVNTIDAGKPSSSLSATLVNGTEIHVTLTGSDDAGGSGVGAYSIFVAVDGGPSQAWLRRLNETETVLTGQPGHSYALYSIAEDNVGNTEDPPAAPDRVIAVPVLPHAAFVANATSGSAPLAVRFTDRSTGEGIDSWSWDVDGDGIEDSATKNPVHTYPSAGTYTVTLTVASAAGSDAATKTDYITVAPLTVLPLPGYDNPPTDPDGDGLYEDLNGNGRLEFADVAACFHAVEWIAAVEPVDCFDYNGNGRIDFNDIVVLFREV